MNLRFLIASLSIVLCIQTLGQEKFIHFSSGITASTISGSNSSINKIGFSGEFMMTKLSNPSFGVEYGVKFIQKGAFTTPNHEKGIYDFYKLHQNYVHVPIKGVYYNSGVTYLFGIAPGYLISFWEANLNGRFSQSEPFRPIEIEVLIAGRVNITKQLNLTAQFSNSALPVRKHKGGAFRFNRGQYNSTLNLTIGYYISK